LYRPEHHENVLWNFNGNDTVVSKVVLCRRGSACSEEFSSIQDKLLRERTTAEKYMASINDVLSSFVSIFAVGIAIELVM
jgi:hypothetical protein